MPTDFYGNPERLTLLVDENNVTVVDPVLNAVRVTQVGGGGGGGGAVTIAEGADANSGSTTDAAVTGDSPGTLSAKIRGLNKILASVWDAVLNRLNVTVKDIEDGTGDSVMDAANDAIQVSIVAGAGTGATPFNVSLNATAPESPARVALTNTTEQTLVPAPGVGLSIYVVDMTGSNEGSQRTRIDLKEGAGGTVRYSYVMAQNGGGFAHSLRAAWKLPANTALVVQQTAAVNAYTTANYFVAA